MWELQNKIIKTSNSTFILALLLILVGCGGEDFSPKPKGYNRIDLPTPQYQSLQEKHPFYFEYSTYSKILRDSSRTAMPHWLNIYYPQFQANVQLTYLPVNKDKKMLNNLLEDARTLIIKHQVKAESIEGGVIKTKKGLNVNVAELSGEVPTQFQFYVTDSTQHFFRGALYFRTATANDSLAPVINYIKKDMLHLLNTLEWRP